jgi:hypothetical protein
MATFITFLFIGLVIGCGLRRIEKLEEEVRYLKTLR